MVGLTGVFSQIGASKVMVIGDLLLDTYTIGKARRISPEAPVAVVHVQREEHRPGGSGNVILNLISLGSSVVAIGRIGADHAGEALCHALSNEGVETRGIYIQKNFPTPVKNRILAENQQIVRVDHEMIMPLPEQLEQEIIESLPELMQGIQVVAVSDYGKGFLSKTLLAAVIELAKKNHIPVIADPKGIDFGRYSGATVIKPNLGEAYAAAGLPLDAPLEQVAGRILNMADAQTLMITRSEAGISLFHRNGQQEHFPVRVREVKDVTGAGDTVLAMLTCALANGLSIATAAQLSNIAAGIAIERFGCARVSLPELARRMLEDDVTNKVFDEEHLFALQQVLQGRSFILLSVDGVQGLTSNIFATIRRLAKEEKGDLLIYIRDSDPSAEFVDLLASLHDVNFILIQSANLKALCSTITPHEMYVVENEKCLRLDSIDDMLATLSIS